VPSAPAQQKNPDLFLHSLSNLAEIFVFTALSILDLTSKAIATPRRKVHWKKFHHAPILEDCVGSRPTAMKEKSGITVKRQQSFRIHNSKFRNF